MVRKVPKKYNVVVWKPGHGQAQRSRTRSQEETENERQNVENRIRLSKVASDHLHNDPFDALPIRTSEAVLETMHHCELLFSVKVRYVLIGSIERQSLTVHQVRARWIPVHGHELVAPGHPDLPSEFTLSEIAKSDLHAWSVSALRFRRASIWGCHRI
jgi:hypothetical protein